MTDASGGVHPSRFSVVVAHTPAFGIGAAGGLPWPKLKKELARFKRITAATSRPGMSNAVIMGRKTWDSLPVKPLPGRVNIVLTSRALPLAGDSSAEVIKMKTLPEALEACACMASVDNVFVIGGAQVYAAAFAPELVNLIDYVYSSVVTVEEGVEHEEEDGDNDDGGPKLAAAPCDVFVKPVWLDGGDRFTKLFETAVEPGVTAFIYGGLSRLSGSLRRSQKPDDSVAYSDPDHDELPYLRLIRSLIYGGVLTDDRTGTGTFSQFGAHLRFRLHDGVMPVLTTKTTFFKGVKEELLTLFVPGRTDAKVLADKGVHIWDKNATAHGVGTDLGPVYGFQWRHFGARYAGPDADYTDQGVDQLKWVIEEIKRNPASRRLVVSAWNPCDIGAMALPPCHVMFQFYVRDNKLSCLLFQRSCDVGLGLPFNIASYALLTHLVAYATGLDAEELVMTFGDVHVYRNHEGPLLEQQLRQPKPFPKLSIAPGTPRDLFAIPPEAVTLAGYESHGRLPMDMSV